ncbi:GMP synthase [Candidatus Bathyarchaeota archaeon]|nr:GMP synthase [Candidatus Bathyarchaeota archaeon]
MSSFDAKQFVEKQIKAVKDVLGNNKAIIAVSGGVDSTVSAVITYKAIGSNLICVFIDDNFMRLGEPERVHTLLSSTPLNLPVKIVDERERFMKALNGLHDAEEKRKAFRDCFYNTFQDTAKREGCKFLVQGTIKADIEETAAGVKTQHNILEQIGINPVERYGYRIVEPLVQLYKWQVRIVARYLGMPNELSERQPFPGPGLSVRVVGEITNKKLEIEKKATKIVEDFFSPLGPSQFFAAILSDSKPKKDTEMTYEIANIFKIPENNIDVYIPQEKATGVLKGNNRVYGNILLVNINENIPNYDSLNKLRENIQNKNPGVSRVLLNVSGRADEGFKICMRAITSNDFLTAEIVKVPWEILMKAADNIHKECPEVGGVYYDLTPKPPATVEFE